MKKSLLIVIGVLLIAAGFYYFYYGNTQKQEQTVPMVVESASNDLPWLPITYLDGSGTLVKDIKGKTVLVLFQPDCDHCQRETVQIREHLSHFDGYELFFVSDANLPEIGQFAQEYQLADIDNIHFAQATINDIIQTVGPIQTPSLFVYSKEGRLVKSFIGETPIEQILPHL